MTILHVPSVAGQEEGEGSLLAWAERAGRRPAAEPGRGGLRFVFYGRVSTEDYQDPVTSRARQRDQAHPGRNGQRRMSPRRAEPARWYDRLKG